MRNLIRLLTAVTFAFALLGGSHNVHAGAICIEQIGSPCDSTGQPVDGGGGAPTGNAGGDLGSTYPNPTVTRINGVALGSTTATAGNVLIGSGTAWVTHAIGGDATLGSTGTLTVTAINGVTLGSTTATAGNLLIGSGSAWVTHALGGDATLGSTGTLTVTAINGVSLGSTTATAGNVLIGSGSAWVTHAIGGDATLGSTGTLTLANSNVTAATYGDATHVAQCTFDVKGRATSCSSVTITNVTGNAATATALAANGANCSANLAAGGVDASGAAEACVTPLLSPGAVTSGQIITWSGTGGQSTSSYAGTGTCGSSGFMTALSAAGAATCATNAPTASALAANGGNCSAGSFPLGVDASGAAESCTNTAVICPTTSYAPSGGMAPPSATASGTTGSTIGQLRCALWQADCTKTGATKLGWRVATGVASATCGVAIYSADGNTLIAKSVQSTTCASNNQDRSDTSVTSYNITAGTSYWVCQAASATTVIFNAAACGSCNALANNYVDGPTGSTAVAQFNAACTSGSTPYTCCSGSGTGSCTGFPSSIGTTSAATANNVAEISMGP